MAGWSLFSTHTNHFGDLLFCSFGELGRKRGEPGQARRTRLGSRDLIEPGYDPIEVDGRRGGDVLQMRLGQVTVAGSP